jgi:AcrR family transcriptional regulator
MPVQKKQRRAQIEPKSAGRPRKTSARDLRKNRILDVAESAFAEHGVDGISLRQIMAAADVSISLVNYHFGTKEQMLTAVFERKAAPLFKERAALLEAAIAAKPRPDLEGMLKAFFLPCYGRSKTDTFGRLSGRVAGDPSPVSKSITEAFFDPFMHRFIDGLRLALPGLSEDELYLRFHCLLSILNQTLVQPNRISDLTNGRHTLRGGSAFANIIPFLVTGLRTRTTPLKSLAAQDRQTGLPSKKKLIRR